MSKAIGVRIEEVNDVVVFSIEGHFDASLANAVNDRVHDILNGPLTKVVFDFSELAYISSAGLRVLLFAAKKMKEKNGEVTLCSVGKGVQRVLDVSGFTMLFMNYPDKDAAIRALSSAE